MKINKRLNTLAHCYSNSNRLNKPTAPRSLIALLLIIMLTMMNYVFYTPSTPAKAAGSLTGLSAKDIVDDMGLGWNLGNTFDATGGNRANIYSQETSWGNPKVTPELIKAVHDRGFRTIRIPVTWNNHIIKDGSYTINPEFLARIKEVVDYAYDLDMYIILNVHHEAWVNVKDLDKSYAKVGEELEAVWSQIADYFADYDQHLIFEGMNEPRMQGSDIEWTGNQAAYTAVNYLNQVFTYTVRSNGKGHNGERCLMIPGYAASSSPDILKTITIPTFEGKAVNNIIISVHCYNPYNFCLSDEMYEFDPTDKNHTSSIDSLFKNLEELFLFNDIPVVIGETSATEKNNTEQRENWAGYMGKKSFEYGIPIVLWDNGANGHSGGECHAWILRSKCEWNYPTVVDKLFEAAESTEWGSLTITDRIAHDSIEEDASSLIGGNVIWQEKNGQTVTRISLSHAAPVSIPMLRSYITASTEIAVCYTGDGKPVLGFATESDGIVVSDIEPYKIENKAGNNVAFYKYRTVNDTLKSVGITNPSQLSELLITSDSGDLNILETDIVSQKVTLSYNVGGESFTSEKSVTLLPGLKVLGWYTTKDYKEGTEYTGEAYKDLTLYGKVFWKKDSVASALYAETHSNDVPEITPETTPTTTPEVTASPEPEVTGSGEDITPTEIDKTQPDTDKSNDKTAADNTNPANAPESGETSVIPILVILLAVVAVLSGTIAVLMYKKNKKK